MNNYYRSDGWVKTSQGPAIPGAQIYICLQPANVTPPITPPRTLPVPWVGPNPQALIYSDAGVTPITQPIITDGFGHYDFYTLPGLYTVVVMFGGKVQQYYVDQSIGNSGSSNPSPLLLSTNGTPNFNQNALNFVQGAGITLATDNLGNTTVTNNASVGPAGPAGANGTNGTTGANGSLDALPKPYVASWMLWSVNWLVTAASPFLTTMPTITGSALVDASTGGGTITQAPPTPTSGWAIHMTPASASGLVVYGPANGYITAWANPARTLKFRSTMLIKNPNGTDLWSVGTNNANIPGYGGGNPFNTRADHPCDAIFISVPITAGVVGNFELIATIQGVGATVDTGISAAGSVRHQVGWDLVGGVLTPIIDGVYLTSHTISSGISTSLQQMILCHNSNTGTGTTTCDVEYAYLEVATL